MKSSSVDSCEILSANIGKLEFGSLWKFQGILEYSGALSLVPLWLRPVIYNKGNYTIFSGITTGVKLLLKNHLEHALGL